MTGLTCIRARPHPFLIDFDSSALLIIDMQHDFLDDKGGICLRLGLSHKTMEEVRKIVPNIRKVLDWARDAKMPVVFTRESNLPDLSDLTGSKRLRYKNAGYPVGSPGPMGRLLVRGEYGTSIIEELAPIGGELEFDKPGQSAFVSTDLEAALREREVTHLIITGVTTQCCVLATYRHASDLGFFSLLLEDCCASFDPEEHRAAIDVLTSEGGAVGWVTTSDNLTQ